MRASGGGRGVGRGARAGGGGRAGAGAAWELAAVGAGSGVAAAWERACRAGAGTGPGASQTGRVERTWSVVKILLKFKKNSKLGSSYCNNHISKFHIYSYAWL